MNILWQRFRAWWLDSYIYLVFFWRTKHGTSTWKQVTVGFSWAGVLVCFVWIFVLVTGLIYPPLTLNEMDKNIGIVKEVNFPKGKFTYDNITLLTDDGKQINYRYVGHTQDKQLIGERVTVWSQNKWIILWFKDELHELQKEDGEFLKNYTYEKALENRERQKGWANTTIKTIVFFLFIIWLLNRKGLSKPKTIQATGDEK
ncbi:MAG: hypothetical protein EOL93_11520 [Epsilonproteobacteria bacterium]|nr:hypothetical protein [Campylobacterota bacterium]